MPQSRPGEIQSAPSVLLLQHGGRLQPFQQELADRSEFNYEEEYTEVASADIEDLSSVVSLKFWLMQDLVLAPEDARLAAPMNGEGDVILQLKDGSTELHKLLCTTTTKL